MRYLYSIGISVYYLAAAAAGLVNSKARLFVSGRRKLFKTLAGRLEGRGDRETVWFHCSSVGEFEQARPLIERLRKESPDKFILITFFSPSGYVLRKDFEYADAVVYLPMDTVRNVRRFLDMVRPATAIFVKYEFWYNYLTELKKRSVPTYIISAIFRKNQIFFKWYGSFMRRVLRCYTMLFVQNEESRRLLARMGIDNVVIAGDTRFDRVLAISRDNTARNDILDAFTVGRKTWVAGSTWEGDEQIISRCLRRLPECGLILVPHEVGPSRMACIRKEFDGYTMLFYSECAGKDPAQYSRAAAEADVLVVDCVGILPKIYKYGSFAYVGGGFSSAGIHNILEAAIYGCPVVFGPHYSKFQEAKDLIALGGAVSVQDSDGLHDVLERWLLSSETLERLSLICTQYVESHLGASDKIVEYIFKNR